MKSPIKVCYVATRDITIRTALLNQMRYLKEGDNYELHVICSPGQWVKAMEKEGINLYPIRIRRKIISPISDIEAILKMIGYFKKETIDIVHTHTPKAAFLGQIAAKIAKVPIVINTLFGFYFHDYTNPIARKLFVIAEKVAARCSDLIFSQNSEDIVTAIREGICDPSGIEYLGAGVDISRFNPGRFSNCFIKGKKRELGIGMNCKVISIITRFVKDKGFLELFEAFQIVKEKFPNTILLVVGPTNMKKKGALRTDVVRQYGIEGKVMFLGFREDVDDLHAMTDIFVLPSHREGFPRSIREASSMGKPVVATDIRGCREAVDDGQTGILVPVKDPQRLAEALIYLLDNPGVAAAMGTRGREKAKREFDEQIVFERVKKEYERLITEKLKSKI